MAVFLSCLTLEEMERNMPTQAFRLGKSLVSCGDVAGLMISSHTESVMAIHGFVHSEKTASVWYDVSVKILTESNEITSPQCVCIASANMRDFARPCKHIVALLLSAIAIQHHVHDTKTPKFYKRPNMKRFEKAPQKLKDQIEYDLSWPEIIARIKNPVPKKRKHATGYNKLITTHQERTKKRKKDPNDICSLKVAELKIQLKEKGLSCTGKKAILRERLIKGK
jgi:hypothetical protein